jgi:tRNA A-37 threonylcarbamoyl transferase component Bud32
VLAKTEFAKTQALSDSISEGTEIAGRYRVLSLIGEGGMGAVYRAQHLQLRKVFALKVLQAKSVDRPDIAARFEREAIAAGRIEHPNVVPATDFGRLPDGSFFLVLEFVNGRSLRSELKAGAMRPSRALGIMRGVVAGVRAAHEKGIVHRDLKPENIMLVDRDGNRDFVKLLDFGVARLDSAQDRGPQLTEAGAMLGTPQYMSPEQILGRAIDARTDLYSLGTVFFELLTGRCPFSGNFATVLEQHVTLAPPELPPALAAEEPRLAEILRILLSKEPEKRFQTAKEVAAAIEEASQQASRASVVGATSPAYAPGALLQRARRFVRDLGRGAPTSLANVVSSASAVASSGVSRVGRYVARFKRRRRGRSLARSADRRVAHTVVAARQIGRQAMTFGRKLGAAARVAWARSIDYCRSQWRLHARGWTLAAGFIAALALIVLLVVAVRSCQGVGGPEESQRPDRAGAKRPLPQPAKTGSSKSHR